MTLMTLRRGSSGRKEDDMRVLVACEESQRVCIAFRERGHEAYSCDMQDCSGGHPEWHIKGDVLPLLDGYCYFWDCKGGVAFSEWKMGHNHRTPTMHISEQRRGMPHV